MKKKKNYNKMASTLGRLGGKVIFLKRGKAYMKKIGKLGAKARWGSR